MAKISKIELVRPPRDDERGNSRQALLDSACALMTQRSTIDISLQDIAKQSGLSAALVKYYFGDKTGMMLAIVEDVLGRSLNELDKLIASELNAEEKISLHVKAVISIYFRYPFINRLFHSLFSDPIASLKIAETVSKPLANYQKVILEQGIASGEFKAVDPMMFYFIILGACDHMFFGKYIMRGVFGINEFDDEMRRQYTETLLELILKGLVRESNGTS